MKKLLALPLAAIMLLWHSLAFGYAIDGMELTGNGPFNDSGRDYVNFDSLAGRKLTGAANFVVTQNNVVLYNGAGPFTFPALPGHAYPIVIQPAIVCFSKYGCTNSLIHLDQPAIATGIYTGYPDKNFKGTELHIGTEYLKGVGMRNNAYTLTAPNGVKQTGVDTYGAISFAATIDQVGTWVLSVQGTPLFSATPKTITKTFNVYSSLDLGAEHYINQMTVNPLQSVKVSQWSNWNWFPTYVEIGIGADDGQSLNDVTVVDERGNQFALSGWYGKISQPYTANPRYFTVKTATPRALSIQWWATTTPNIIDLGAEHTKVAVDITGPATVQTSIWPRWNFTPNNIGFGFTSNDGMPLDGIQVKDLQGRVYSLSGWYTTVNQPFAWAPVQLIIPGQNRKVNVEWWGSAN